VSECTAVGRCGQGRPGLGRLQRELSFGIVLDRTKKQNIAKPGDKTSTVKKPPPDTCIPTPQSGPNTAPVYPSGGFISGIPAQNDAVLHTFSKIAFSSRFTPNGAISFEP